MYFIYVKDMEWTSTLHVWYLCIYNANKIHKVFCKEVVHVCHVNFVRKTKYSIQKKND
jgi:hypothetical protein